MLENKWILEWQSSDYKKIKTDNFDTIDRYFNKLPKKILDIGCGLAFESELFYKKYNSELFLLDGDFSSTNHKIRDIKYGDIDDFKFYSSIEDLKKSFDTRNLKYNFIDANDIKIDNDVIFDLVYSSISCGFHYPANTYKNLINKHTNTNSVVIMDIRKSSFEDQSEDFDIISIIKEERKHFKVHLRFK